MSDLALSRIDNLMKVEDDLAKLPSLRQQLMQEKISLDRQLTTTTHQQIDLIMSNLSKLNQAVVKLNNIKLNIAKVNHVYDDSITNVKDYDTIRKMTVVNQFLNQVNSIRIDIENYRRYLDSLNGEIEAELDLILGDIAYPLTNILQIHYKVNQARNFLDYLQLESGLSDDLRSIVYKIVAPLKKTIRLFDALLAESIISITESARDGNLQLVFKLITIIEYEANEDLKFELMSNLDLNSNIDIKSLDYKHFRNSKRDYKKFFYDKLKDGLNDTFDKCLEHFQEDKMLVFENLNWLEEELVFVHQELNPIFPSNWEISTFIQNVYYNNLHKFTMQVIDSEPPAEDLMAILRYDSHYSKFIGELQVPDTGDTKRKSLVKKEQRSIIGEDLKNSVLEDYMKVIILRNDEWNKNLIEQESATFTNREYPPDKYVYVQTIEDEDANDQLIVLDVENEVYVLPDFKTPLTMLKEQADVAADSGYSKILVGVVENWSMCYIQRIQNYKSIIEDEFARYMTAYTNQRFLIQQSKTERFFRLNSKKNLPPVDVENMTPEELAEISREGLIEYLAALGNTYEINTDRLQDKFLERYKEKVHASYHARLDKSFEDILTPSTDLNAQVIRTIVDIIINDIYPALSEAFTKSWIDSGNPNDESSMAHRIIDTIAEYLSELRSYCSYDIYQVTSSILLDSFVSDYIRIGYCNIIYGSGKKIDPQERKKFKSFTEAIGRDVTIFYDGLAPLFTRKDTRYLLGSLRAIEYLGEMATCNDPEVSIPQFWEDEILPAYYYCSVEYVRGILLCRKDMDKNTVNQIITEITRIQQEYHKNVEPTEFPMGTLTDFTFN